MALDSIGLQISFAAEGDSPSRLVHLRSFKNQLCDNTVPVIIMIIITCFKSQAYLAEQVLFYLVRLEQIKGNHTEEIKCWYLI